MLIHFKMLLLFKETKKKTNRNILLLLYVGTIETKAMEQT